MARNIDVSIILPVYNETARLVSGLSSIVEYLEKGKKRQNSQKFEYEIIMIDDGSTVPASEVINHSYLQKTILRLIKQKKFKGYRLETNQGKGKAIATGVRYAKGDSIVFTDIDGSVPIQTLPKLLHALTRADIAIGSRRVPEAVILLHQSLFRETGGRVYTFLSRMLFGLPVHDVTCGFKGFRKTIAKDLFSHITIHRWAFDTEILALAMERGYSIAEIPVAWSNKEGSKVRIEDTLLSCFDLLRILWNQGIGQYGKTVQADQLSAESAKRCDSCGNAEFRFLFDHPSFAKAMGGRRNTWSVQECKVCGLAQVIPRPSKKDVAGLYEDDEAHFAPYIKQEFVHRRYFRNKLSLLRQGFGGQAARSIKLLDIGCLTGVLLDEARSMGMKVEGIDISKDAVFHCRNRGLLVHEGTLETLYKKHPGKRYDAITAFEIIEHEYSPNVMVKTMYAMLKKDGVAMVSTPNHGSFWRTVMGKRWPGYTHPEHLYFFDRASIDYLFKHCGFREIKITTGDARPFPLWFLFTRGADYFPGFAPILKMLGTLTRFLPLQNPINPWDDLLVVAKK